MVRQLNQLRDDVERIERDKNIAQRNLEATKRELEVSFLSLLRSTNKGISKANTALVYFSVPTIVPGDQGGRASFKSKGSFRIRKDC